MNNDGNKILDKIYSTGGDKEAFRNFGVFISKQNNFSYTYQKIMTEMTSHPKNEINLIVLDFLYEYGCEMIVDGFVRPQVLDVVINLLKEQTQAGVEVQKQVIFLTQKWMKKYGSNPKYKLFMDNYNNLKNNGVIFPPENFMMETFQKFISEQEMQGALNPNAFGSGENPYGNNSNNNFNPNSSPYNPNNNNISPYNSDDGFPRQDLPPSNINDGFPRDDGFPRGNPPSNFNDGFPRGDGFPRDDGFPRGNPPQSNFNDGFPRDDGFPRGNPNDGFPRDDGFPRGNSHTQNNPRPSPGGFNPYEMGEPLNNNFNTYNDFSPSNSFTDFESDPINLKNKWTDKLIDYNKWIDEGKYSFYSSKLKQGIEEIVVVIDYLETRHTKLINNGQTEGARTISYLKKDMEQTCWRYSVLMHNQKPEPFISAFSGNPREYTFSKDELFPTQSSNRQVFTGYEYSSGAMDKLNGIGHTIKSGFVSAGGAIKGAAVGGFNWVKGKFSSSDQPQQDYGGMGMK